MSTPPAAISKSPPPKAIIQIATPPAEDDPNRLVRLHITPFNPALSKVYIAPSVQPLVQNISFHTIDTFPEKGFGYVELPAMEAAKLKKKLNGLTLKGSKVKIEEAKPEKRKKIVEEIEWDGDEQPAKRTKREKKKKEIDVIEGVELPDGRKVKRGWTEVSGKKKKEKKEDREERKKDKKDKKAQRKESKYSKEPELLFNAVLTPVAATAEAIRKDKKKEKKDKKDKKSHSNREVVVHEFEHNTKQPSFLKTTKVATEAKPAVEYVNGKGWVDEDGNVVEPETGKARNRRLLELVDKPAVVEPPAKTTEVAPSPKPKPAKKPKKKEATPPPSSSESDGEESSVISSSSDDASEPESESDAESEDIAPVADAPTDDTPMTEAPQISLTPSSPAEQKEVHPLEALYKRPKPPTLPLTTSTPSKGLAPIQTSFSFFDTADNADIDADATENNPPATPFTERDLEWRGQRSAAPTPDTAAIGRRFSFDWRKGSAEIEDEDEEDDDEVDVEAEKEISRNTKANAANGLLPGLKEVGGEKEGEEEESEFGKWFWENRGENNRAWKKRRRESLKATRLRENRKITGGGRGI